MAMNTPNNTLHIERQLRWLRITTLFAAMIAVAALWLAWRSYAREVPPSGAMASLRLNELAVVDSSGVVRARLSGNVPDAVIKGHRAPRGGKAAGLIIYDGTGQERGGYVTFDDPQANALLSLDTRNGQVAYFVADAEHGVALSLWTAGNQVELRADSGAARMTTTSEGTIVLQQPPMSAKEITEHCEALRSELIALKEVPPFSVLLSACMQRLPEADCRKCLEPWSK